MLSAVRNRVNQVLHLEDSPHRLALGFAVGIFVAWTPTIGLQMLLAALLTWLCRANKLIAIAVVWISNPYTALPIYWFNYLVGYWCVGGEKVNWAWFDTLLTRPEPNMGFSAYLSYAYHKMTEVAYPLILGSCLVGIVLALVSYPLILRLFKKRDLRNAALATTPSTDV